VRASAGGFYGVKIIARVFSARPLREYRVAASRPVVPDGACQVGPNPIKLSAWAPDAIIRTAELQTQFGCQASPDQRDCTRKRRVRLLFNRIDARTANEAWKAAAELLRTGIDQHHSNPLGGGSREVHHVAISIEDPRQRWVFARRPPINPAFALAEVVWMSRGRNDAAFLTHWNKALRRFVGDDPILHGAYGHRLRYHFGADQLVRAAGVLSNSPSSRQAVLQIWDARNDLPQPDGTPVSKDIPCNVISCLKMVDGHLEWLQLIRSNDIFRLVGGICG
jgi:hypothetical protein